MRAESGSAGSSVLSLQQSEETLFKTGLFGPDGEVGNASLAGLPLQLGGKVQRTDDGERAVVHADRVPRCPGDPGHQIAPCRALGFDAEGTAVVKEGPGGTSVEGLDHRSALSVETE